MVWVYYVLLAIMIFTHSATDKIPAVWFAVLLLVLAADKSWSKK